jgi:hypothetical protein
MVASNSGSAISTYGGRGTLKQGCTPSEHAVVYLTGTQPTLLDGEWERGMTKDPIEIEPTSATETMGPTSRLRFGKIHSIEWNVKVREIGVVSRKHMSKLLAYYQEEDGKGFDDDEDDEEPDTTEPRYLQDPAQYAPVGHAQANDRFGYVSHQPYQYQYQNQNQY